MPSALSDISVGSLRRALAARLEHAFAADGREGTAALDARLLLAHALGVEAASLALRDGDPVDAQAEALARSFIERRIAGEPVARIVGSREFWGLEFLLGPDTLIPRPDTETLVEAALAFVRATFESPQPPHPARRVAPRRPLPAGERLQEPAAPLHLSHRESSDTAPPSNLSHRSRMFPTSASLTAKRGYTHVWAERSDRAGASRVDPGEGLERSRLHDPRHAPTRILDIGTGSGAILLALLAELPNASGVGTDISSGALRLARRNAGRLGLASRASFVRSDWGTAVAGRFDLVVSNPPYVRSGEIAALPVEVGRHDPHLALDGGADGLGAARAILSDLGRLLDEGGKAFLEIGLGQAPQIADLAAKQGFAAVFRRDLAGIERVAEIGRVIDG